MNRYQEFPPPNGLARVVDCVWKLTPEIGGATAAVDRIFPDGATDIVISAGMAMVHGPAPSFRMLQVTRPMFGFRLHRGAARRVLGIGPSELAGGPIPVATLWGRHGRAFGDQLADCSTPAAQAAALADFLMQRMPDADLDQAVQQAIDRIDRTRINQPCDGALRSLAREAGLSERHLRRRFQDHVGIGIKRYGRIVRFQHVLDATRQYKRRFGLASPGWAGLACDHGFADQAHLIREVRAFAGLTPAQLLLSV